MSKTVTPPKGYRTVVDELGLLQAKLKPLRDREKQLREEVLGWCDKLDGDAEVSFEGERYAAAVSARRMERTIVSMPRLLQKLGLKLFLKGCTVASKFLDEHLTPVQQKGLVKEDRTGARVITTGKKAA